MSCGRPGSRPVTSNRENSLTSYYRITYNLIGMVVVDNIPVSEAQWRAAYGLSPERDTAFTTLSGEEIKPLYTARDLPPEADAAIGLPGQFPYTRGRVPVDVPRTAVDDAAVRRLRDAGGDERALPLPARARSDRPLDRVRHALADGPRLGPPALAGRGRARGRGGRHGARHGDAVRGDPARRGHGVDDDQRAGGDHARVLRRRGGASGRRRRSASAARSRPTSSRSTSPRRSGASRSTRRCGS